MRIYVGTYAKYNSGNLRGAWLDLEDYSDKEEFLIACAALHADESDPEFMFQDWEEIPEGMVSESYIKQEAFDFAALDQDVQDMVRIYREDVDQDATVEQIQEAYYGDYETEKAFAEEFAIETGAIDSDSPMFSYIDWEHYWNGELRFDFVFTTGKVFRNL